MAIRRALSASVYACSPATTSPSVPPPMGDDRSAGRQIWFGFACWRLEPSSRPLPGAGFAFAAAQVPAGRSRPGGDLLLLLPLPVRAQANGDATPATEDGAAQTAVKRSDVHLRGAAGHR